MLIGVLIYASCRALTIYIPQYYDSKAFKTIKSDAGIESVNAGDIIRSETTDLNDNTSLQTTNNNTGLLSLVKKNSNFSGWLSIEDTDIDYPVMKSTEKDPEYYLHRDFNGDYSFSGSLFIGEGCDVDSDIFVIYGHNMNAGTMFGKLDSYKDPVFAQEHKNIVFQTLSGNHVYRVFASFQTKIYREPTDTFEYYRSIGKLSSEEYDYALKSIRDLSIISLNEAPQNLQQIMLLSTCSYHTDEGRFVVAAYRIV